MALLERLQILIDADAKGALREFEKTGKEADKLDAKLKSGSDKTAARLTSIGTKAALGGVAVLGGLAKLATMSDEAEKQQMKLQNSIKNSDQAFSNGGKSLKDLAQNLQQVTAADGDAIVGAESLLVQFGLTESQVKRVTPLVVDLSRKMGIDLNQAAKLVGKSVEGNAGALKKLGINVDATKAKTDAFGATVDALSGSVGGFARQEGATFSGQIEILKNNLGDLGETVGKGAASVFVDMASGLNGALGAANRLNPAIGETVGRVGAIAATGATTVGTLMVIAGQFNKLKDAAVNAEGGLTAFGKAGAAIAGVVVAVGAFETTAGILNGIQGIAQKQAASMQALGKSAKMSNKDVVEIFSNLAQFEDLKVKPSKIITDFTDSTVDFDGIKVRISEVKKSFDDLLKTGNTAAAGKVIKGLEEQTRKLDVNSDAYRTNYDAIGKLRQKYSDYKGSIDVAVSGQAQQAKAVQKATDAYNEQNVTLQYAQDRIKDFNDKVKVLTSTYDMASTGAKAFGEQIERSTALDNQVSAANRAGTEYSKLGEVIKNLPKDIDLYNLAFGDSTEEQRKAVDAFLSTGSAIQNFLQSLIAGGASPEFVSKTAARYRDAITKALVAQGKDPQEYLTAMGLTDVQVQVALNFEKAQQALVGFQAYLSVWGKSLEDNPDYQAKVKPYLDKQDWVGAYLVTAEAVQKAANQNPVKQPVVMVPGDGSNQGAPGNVGAHQGRVPDRIPLTKPGKKKAGKALTGFGSWIPGFATGGEISAGTLATVNERGPEMFVPRTSGFVMNASESKALVSGVQQLLAGNSGHTFNITSTDPVLTATEVVRKQRDAAYLIGR